MTSTGKRPPYRPSLKELDDELRRVRRSAARRKWLKALAVLAILALLGGVYLASREFALMSVTGDGMRDTLRSGDVVFLRRGAEVKRGDVVAFEREGSLMIRRVIALSGDEVTVYQDGTVSVNSVILEEKYRLSRGRDQGDTEYPFTVPEARVFVLGDHRLVSADSRSLAVGTVALREIVGRVEAKIWPIERIGALR